MSPASASQPLRILLIEDNDADVMLLRHSLKATSEPFELEVLHDGEEALRFVQTHRTFLTRCQPHIVILDLHLPKFDGMSVLEALRQEGAWSAVKVAVVTAGASPQEEMGLAKLRVDLYRKKPRELQDFMQLGRDIVAFCQGNQTVLSEPESGRKANRASH